MEIDVRLIPISAALRNHVVVLRSELYLRQAIADLLLLKAHRMVREQREYGSFEGSGLRVKLQQMGRSARIGDGWGPLFHAHIDSVDGSGGIAFFVPWQVAEMDEAPLGLEGRLVDRPPVLSASA